MILRRAVAGDAEVWRSIRIEALTRAPEAFSARLADWRDRPVADFAADLAANPTFLAFDGAVPVGCIAWTRDGDEPRRGWIGGAFVAEGARGQGVGQALIAAALADARAAGIAEMWLEVRAGNAAAQTAYRRAGFEVVDDPARPSRSCAGEVGMRRSLV